MFFVPSKFPWPQEAIEYLASLGVTIQSKREDGYFVTLSPWEYGNLKLLPPSDDDKIAYAFGDMYLIFYPCKSGG